MNVNKSWVIYKPDTNYYYKIIIFDGLKKYLDCFNTWYSIGDNIDKLILVNSQNEKIIIPSIDIWKTTIFKKSKYLI